ncbi:MAG: hypothetical protein OXG51_00795 [Gammaproteobacteria bacterium]|nr:hypothetical protein [Gammaproteobacteria bacterium]
MVSGRNRGTAAHWLTTNESFKFITMTKRQSLREARKARQSIAEAKLRALDEAVRHSFPVGDIEKMLREIEANRLPE